MKTYGVFGLGKSGKAAVDYLQARGNKVFAWDDNTETRKESRHKELNRQFKFGRKYSGDTMIGSSDGVLGLLLGLLYLCTFGLILHLFGKKNVEFTPPNDWDWDKINVLILSVEIPPTHPINDLAKINNVKIIGEVALQDNK